MVLNGYSAADALSYVDAPYPSRFRWEIVRGQPADQVHSEPWRMKMPPDWGAYSGVRIDNLYHHEEGAAAD